MFHLGLSHLFFFFSFSFCFVLPQRALPMTVRPGSLIFGLLEAVVRCARQGGFVLCFFSLLTELVVQWMSWCHGKVLIHAPSALWVKSWQASLPPLCSSCSGRWLKYFPLHPTHKWVPTQASSQDVFNRNTASESSRNHQRQTSLAVFSIVF